MKKAKYHVDLLVQAHAVAVLHGLRWDYRLVALAVPGRWFSEDTGGWRPYDWPCRLSELPDSLHVEEALRAWANWDFPLPHD